MRHIWRWFGPIDKISVRDAAQAGARGTGDWKALVAVVAALLREEARRRAEGRADHQIFMRPDHGQEILDDLTRGAMPGYPAIGRLKGLAELRGIERALSHPAFGFLHV